MRLKIVLHIKIQFVSSDLMVVNKSPLQQKPGSALPPAGGSLTLQQEGGGLTGSVTSHWESLSSSGVMNFSLTVTQ